MTRWMETTKSLWTRKHLLGLEELSADEIRFVLDTADSFKEVSTRSIKKLPTLRGRVVVNAFFEDSTRTRSSFTLAAQRMSADVLDILKKGRVPVERFHVDIVGDRAPNPPRRFTAIALIFRISGPTSADRPKVERAVTLSRETYCSVTHTLRPDLDLTFEIRLD
jgi:hypothetical protein